MFNDFDTQIQSDELAVLYHYWDNDYEENDTDSDDDADCFCDD